VNPTNHVVLAIHLSQKSRVILAILAILAILLILTILTILMVHVIQVVLDIPDLLTGRMIQSYHVLLIFPLVQRDQLLLMVQNNLGLSANLIVLEYLVLLVVQTISETP